MANPEHERILKEGVAAWNAWREENRTVRPNLTRVDLRGANLRRADLNGAALQEANLSRADLNDAKLHRASLSKADVSGADLGDSDLERADLRQTDFGGAKLIDANLINADLGGADLSKANCGGALLKNANLSKANLTDAGLIEANLENARLVEANLTRANLTEVNFAWASLIGANLDEANLARAYLGDANLNRASLSGTRFAETTLLETVFADVDLSSARGLESCGHAGPSVIDHRTLQRSSRLPRVFLQGCGLPDRMIEYADSLLTDPIEFHSCFISYSTQDETFAKRLHADLQQAGVRCWFAPEDLKIGDKTWDSIDRAIQVHSRLLLILSERSIASDWVEDEVTKAYAEERRRKETVLFPVRIDDAVKRTNEPWVAKVWDGRHIGDFTRWKDPNAYDAGLKRLLRDLKAGPRVVEAK